MSSFICPEFVQNFFMSRICLEKISGIFHVQNLSCLFVQILSRFFSCLEYVQNLSGFLDMKNSRQSFFRTFSRHFLDMKKNSGQFPDNFDDIFRIFLFYRGIICPEFVQNLDNLIHRYEKTWTFSEQSSCFRLEFCKILEYNYLSVMCP